VHAGVEGTLGEGQQFRNQHVLIAVDALLVTGLLVIALEVQLEHTKLGAFDLVQHARAVFLLVDGVLVIAQESEVVVAHPLHEVAGFLMVSLGDGRRTVVTQFLQRLGALAAHGVEVSDGNAHFGQHFTQAGLEVFQRLGVVVTIDLDVDQRLAVLRGVLGTRCRHALQLAGIITCNGQHGVVDGVNGDATTVELDTHGIDQERHVRVQHFDDGVRRLPAMLLEVRVVGTHLGSLEALQEVPYGQGGTVEVIQLALGHVLEGGRCVIVARKRRDHVHLVLGKSLVQLLFELRKKFLLAVRRHV